MSHKLPAGSVPANQTHGTLLPSLTHRPSFKFSEGLVPRLYKAWV